MKLLKSNKAEGYIVPCVFILIFAMIFAMIFTYSASISKVNLMRENTKVVLDSFLTQNSTEIYNSIKQGNDYTEVIDTEEFRTSLISFCTLEIENGIRLVRQGNENPEVEIYSYVTEQTFDAYLYQLVENKQKFIGQIMTSKSPVRSAEDVDEQALSYAEIKALATGNPYIKEKMDLDVAVSKLKLLKQNHLSQRYSLEDRIIKFYPQQIKQGEERIAGYNADIQRAKENTFLKTDNFSPMVVEDVTYDEKKGAGSAILVACKAMTSPEPKVIGSYRGFNMELSFNSFEKEYVLTLVGSLRHSVSLGADIYGNITRLDNLISSMPDKLKACEERLADTKVQLENAKAEVERPFPQEEELSQKMERLAELNALLDMDHKDNEIVDGEPDVADSSERNRSKEVER